MADKTTETSGKSFDQLLKEAPRASEVMNRVTLSGTLLRSDTEGKFVLAMEGGQQLELGADAVKSHRVQDVGGQQIVQIEVDASKVAGGQAFRPGQITIKETWKDPLADGTTLAYWDRPHTLKEQFKDPITDIYPKQPGTDPIGGTLAEQVTQPEVIDPMVQAQAAVPFMMATPHHAPYAPAMMRSLTQTLGAQKTVVNEAITNPLVDRFPTIKEMATDPLLETYAAVDTHTFLDTHPLADHPQTLKEAISDPQTLYEPTGTLAEQIGPNLGGFVNQY